MGKQREIAALFLAASGGVIIYAGATGYHIDDALRVILGQKPIHDKRKGFSATTTISGTAVGANQTDHINAAPDGFHWDNGKLLDANGNGITGGEYTKYNGLDGGTVIGWSKMGTPNETWYNGAPKTNYGAAYPGGQTPIDNYSPSTGQQSSGGTILSA